MTEDDIEAQAARAEMLRASRARLEAAHGPIPALSPEEMDASETEIRNHLRRGRSGSEPK